ncbi:MAG: 2-succinyl-5-enolpyruvyl-6-hydroxy-3-cyclohexene-1-carboxylic-acid synthase [Actinomycetota bacterium]|nr:2-succinyl-5-enolpyruvyl-6-hydroxy-3-cyclohexene-1-carboxylic-acid synthase [Actinomycetota bacterium]
MSMIPINRTYAPVQALVDELARCGMRHAVTSPGSRNAPIALTLAADDRIDAVSVIDERAAGFMALGMAKATGRPVAVTCTSGTAAANLAPAVHEAAQARVPLIVLSADRPPELREVGAGQAIDQIKLFGSAAKWFVEVGQHEPRRATAVHHRALGCRAYWTAAGDRPGPVHLNLALREPLAPALERKELDPAPWSGRDGGRPWIEVREAPPQAADADLQALADRISRSARGAIVCGGTGEEVAPAVVRLAAAAGWPVLAEPTSGVRCGGHDLSHVVAHYDVLLRHEGFAVEHAPELVLRVGDTPTSKPLRAWLANAAQVVLDPSGAWHEPTRGAETLLRAAAGPTCDALAQLLEQRGVAPSPGWVGAWRAADAVVPPIVAEAPQPCEPLAYTAASGALTDGTIVWLASSMPVRDVESFWPAGPERVRFLSNRGANGIDGTLASAAGAARATGSPVLVLIGELALLHDLGGLLAAQRAGIDLTVICVDNGGGGIFDFLPVAVAADPELYREHVATPSGLNVGAVATLAGMEHRTAVSAAEVRDAVAAGPGLIEVRADRSRNVGVHRDIYVRAHALL